LATAAAFLAAAFLSVLIAWASVLLIERLSQRAVRSQPRASPLPPSMPMGCG